MNNKHYWYFKKEGFDSEKIVDYGNGFMLGNGYMGYRGTLEEYKQSELVAVNLAGVYDQVEDKWRETINAPNGLFTEIYSNGKPYRLPETKPHSHLQELSLHDGIHTRHTQWQTTDGNLTVKSNRFLSMKDVHLLCMEYRIKADYDSDITVKTGIDYAVWDINGPHLHDHQTCYKDDVFTVTAVTSELKIPVVVSEIASYDFAAKTEQQNENGMLLRSISFKAIKHQEYVIRKYVTVYTGLDTPTPYEAGIELLLHANALGYTKLHTEHIRCWEQLWKHSMVEITGDDEAQQAIIYSLYHLHIIAPRHKAGISIAARGLSGQTYKGAIFWDTEIFLLPFFMHTEPKTARNLIEYRIKTLDGARKKAAEYGFRGAFYAWESHEDGQDACSDYNVTDVFTGRPVRTFFRDKQIHISGDIAYALWNLYEYTKDDQLLLDGGAELLFECARFYYSYATLNLDRNLVEFHDVIGPDEYHERVNNNAFTNRMALFTIQAAIRSYDYLSSHYPNALETLVNKIAFHEDILRLKDIVDKTYMPAPIKSLDHLQEIIPQFDGYFKLEDCSVSTVKERLLHPREYWGGANGVAAHTQIIKQADIVTLLWLFRNEYTQQIKLRNWEYYEPRTEHGSSLSACMYALTACEIGRQDLAYPLFMKSASIDMLGGGKQYAGDIYIGGSHPAASGGAWMTAIFGFGGLHIEDGKISASPRLPSHWEKLSYTIALGGNRYRILVTQENATISLIEE